MDYVIYGAGYRGGRLLDYMGAECVRAFIDMDKEKQGKEYLGKPVICLDEYAERYDSCFIIITPAYSDNIERTLEENHIYQYTNLTDMPSEFAGYGEAGFEDCYGGLKCGYGGMFCIYGIHALSFLLYDFLHQDKCVSICPEGGCKPQKTEWLKKYHPEIRLKERTGFQDGEIILMSMAGWNEEKFSNKTLNLFEYASNNPLYRNEKLLRFKGSNKAQRSCFIVATGPSLRLEDLHTLAKNNIFCFGVNSIHKIGGEWVADAYIATDSDFINSNMCSIENYECGLKFIGDACKEYWTKEREDSYKIHVAAAGGGIDFSEEVEQKLYCGYRGQGTVTYVCIQLAVYMGFSEIYLLGVDCNYVMGSKNNHFIADEKEDNRNHREDSMIKAYEYAKKYADSHGVKIYNATRGGMLEVFERVDFDSLFEDKNRSC